MKNGDVHLISYLSESERTPGKDWPPMNAGERRLGQFGNGVNVTVFLPVLTISLLLSACSVGPRYNRAAVATPPAYKEIAGGNDQWKVASPSDGVLKGKWWELFGDPQLNKLEEMVSVSNQNVKQAEAEFREARALVALNRAGYFPTIGTSPSITNSHELIQGRGSTSNTFSLPFSASWEPDLWGRVRLSVENATASAQSSDADLENVRLSMQTTLAVDYFNMLGLDMQTALLTDTVTAYDKALQLTTNRFNGGVASKADVMQARTQLETTRAQLIDLGVARAQFEHAIAVLTGQPPSNLTLPPGKIAGSPPPIPAGLPSQLLERRPDIAAAERQMAAANAEIGLARAAYYPTLTLSATAGLSAGNLASFFSWPARFWSVGPSLSETLFDFGRRRAQLQQSEAAYDANVAAYRQTTLSAFQAVEDNLAALRILAQEVDQQDVAVKAAEESLRLEIDRYKGGTDSYLNVITTQTIALGDESTAVQLLARRMVAAVQLVSALGGGWNASTLPTPADMKSASAAKPAPTN
jgi:NodT family efflux transporter outer membrane factor (OMF) lipoprotein